MTQIGYTDPRINGIIKRIQHASYLFPSITSAELIFTAGSENHTFSEWAEIACTENRKFSDMFIDKEGQISGIEIFSCSKENVMYLCELAYGAEKELITSFHFTSNDKDINTVSKLLRVASLPIPANEKVYYRMMCAEALSTLTLGFRYHYH